MFAKERIEHLHKQLENALQTRLYTQQRHYVVVQQALNREIERVLDQKRQLLGAKKSRLCAYSLQTRPKQQQIEACFFQLTLTLTQILRMHKKRLQNLQIALEWYNNSSNRQKGWVQVWHKGALAKLSEIGENDEFVLSDQTHKAVVKMLRKQRKGEENG